MMAVIMCHPVFLFKAVMDYSSAHRFYGSSLATAYGWQPSLSNEVLIVATYWEKVCLICALLVKINSLYTFSMAGFWGAVQ
jgi:hypothetical protein